MHVLGVFLVLMGDWRGLFGMALFAFSWLFSFPLALGCYLRYRRTGYLSTVQRREGWGMFFAGCFSLVLLYVWASIEHRAIEAFMWRHYRWNLSFYNWHLF